MEKGNAENYTFMQEDQCLHVRLTGHQDLEVLQQLVHDIVDQCMATTCRHVLVDARESTGAMNTVDKYELGMTAASFSMSGIKVACVDMGERTDYFFETVAVNRGVSVRIFTDYDEAQAWLLNSNSTNH